MSSAERSLLIIDDDTRFRQETVAYLRDRGFKLWQADNGQAGLSSFKRHSPDIVLTELNIPGLDGLQLLEKVQAISPSTPVIIMSEAGEVADVVQSLRLGADDFLIKPLQDMEVLLLAINKSLDNIDLIAENLHYREELEQTNAELKESVRTLEKDQEAGRQVQQRLLPPTPVKRGNYTFEHRVIPSLFLSGDFIDMAFRSERYLSFYLSDVSGHGASSAFATIWLKHAATEIMNEKQLFSLEDNVSGDVNCWLTEINKQLLDTRLGHHMTCLVGVADLVEHQLHYAVAGHLPLPVLITGDKAEFLEGKGRPLGLFPNQEWQSYQIDFPPGATFLAFSDGILEVMPATDLLEKESFLLELLSNNVSGMSGAISALGLSDLASAPDDIAIFSIQRNA